ncbi:MAG: LysM peptidoglycan-binding domain-containing protein [Gammaproteobacteria bacterium]|jgi:membrane-bound lytic murein transglycosylase D
MKNNHSGARLPNHWLTPVAVGALLLLGGCAGLMPQASPPPAAATPTAPAETATVEPPPLEVVAPDNPAQARDLASLMPNGRLPGQRPDDLWVRIREGFRLPTDANPRIGSQRDWYARHDSYLDRVVTRAQPYLYFIVQQLEARDMPTEFALLPVVESAYDPFAYSHGRAAGLWQFIPGTGRRFELKQDWWYDGRRDIAESTRAALDYLQYLHDQFNGDWLLALAAYNSGEGTVRRAVNYNRRYGRSTDFWHLRLPRETSAYVPKLLALQEIVAHPSDYQVSLDPIPNQPYLAQVKVDGQIDLALAAQLADIDLDELYRLNPGYNHWATDPHGPQELFVPVDKKSQFENGLANLPPRERIHWQRHRVLAGETLGGIADRYSTTVHLIKQVNSLHSNIIHIGQFLTVPTSVKNLSNYTLSASQRLKRTQNRPHGDSKVKYTVRSGDSFWRIARHFGVSVGQLARWNGMAPADTLSVGQSLVVWLDGNAPQAVAQRVAQHPSNVIRKIRYRVRSGDSLARISSRFGVTVGELARWNGLDLDDYLQPGQMLKLYVDVTSQSTRS